MVCFFRLGPPNFMTEVRGYIDTVSKVINRASMGRKQEYGSSTPLASRDIFGNPRQSDPRQ